MDIKDENGIDEAPGFLSVESTHKYKVVTTPSVPIESVLWSSPSDKITLSGTGSEMVMVTAGPLPTDDGIGVAAVSLSGGATGRYLGGAAGPSTSLFSADSMSAGVNAGVLLGEDLIAEVRVPGMAAGTPSFVSQHRLIVFKIQIENPVNQADFDLTEQNHTSTPQVLYTATVLPASLNWQGAVSWTSSLEYDTTQSRGPWHSSRSFQTQGGVTTPDQGYSSEGGRISVTAAAVVEGTSAQASATFTVTGASIPDTEITQRLLAIYSGLTPNLLTGIAVEESQYRHFDAGLVKYGVTGSWPYESKSDGGSHIGLMQMGTTKTTHILGRAWNWLTNTQDAVDLINANLTQSRHNVTNVRAGHANLRDLTAYEHENNAVALYRFGTYYYAPNSDYTDWQENRSTQNAAEAVDYTDRVRDNLR